MLPSGEKMTLPFLSNSKHFAERINEDLPSDVAAYRNSVCSCFGPSASLDICTRSSHLLVGLSCNVARDIPANAPRNHTVLISRRLVNRTFWTGEATPLVPCDFAAFSAPALPRHHGLDRTRELRHPEAALLPLKPRLNRFLICHPVHCSYLSETRKALADR